jgi:FG-GAP repeat/FG-GAP-like repeat
VVATAVSSALLTAGGADAAAAARPFDLNGDGFAELVVGVPNESLGTAAGTGAVAVLNGSATGVVAAGNRLLAQSTPGVAGGDEAFDNFGAALASADFDRDGFADLAVGAPGENAAETVGGHGAVTVLYGSASGVGGRRDQRLTPGNLAVADLAAYTLEAGDLNGDGFGDLVTASGSWLDESHPHGGLTVVYGSSTGLRLTGTTHLDESAAGAPGPASQGDQFGRSMAVGDVTGDGIADLVAGTVRDGWVGGLYLFRGRPTGLSTTADQFLSQDSPTLAPTGTEWSEEGLGKMLAIGDFDGDGHGDVAAADVEGGPPGHAGCYAVDECPGAVLVLPGTSSGMDTAHPRVWSSDSSGVPGTAEAQDAFGGAMDAGDLDGDGRADLAVGVVGDDASPQEGFDAGAVDVLFGSPSGLTAARSQRWSQATPAVSGFPRRFDGFGSDVRVAQMGRSRAADLAVSVLGKDTGTVVDSGAVGVLYGVVGRGLAATGSQQWSQGNPGVAGTPEDRDRFGVLGR